MKGDDARAFNEKVMAYSINRQLLDCFRDGFMARVQMHEGNRAGYFYVRIVGRNELEYNAELTQLVLIDHKTVTRHSAAVNRGM